VDAAEFATWRLETDLMETLIRQVEDAERAILQSMGCPTDPVKIERLLQGAKGPDGALLEPPPPAWKTKKRTAQRDRQRAVHAMYTLVFLSQVRGHTGLKRSNARRAAHDALLAGLYANDAAAKEAIASQAKAAKDTGGTVRGRQLVAEGEANRCRCLKLAKRYDATPELQMRFKTALVYVTKETGWSDRTVRDHLRKKK
jgi:hypothetical protein